MTFSPDSKLLAFVDVYEGVHLWSLDTRREIVLLPAYFHDIDSLGVAFSPDGQTLAYNENEAGDIVLWNVPSQSVTRRLKGHERHVTSLAFTPNGEFLLSSSLDKTVKMWEVLEGSERRTFTSYGVGGFRMSPDGKLLATSATRGDQQIIVQELPSGRELLRLRGHPNLITDGGFSPDGRTLITAGVDGTVRLWDVTRSRKNTESLSCPTNLAEVWDGDTRKGSTREVRSEQPPWVQYRQPRSSKALTLSPDGEHLLLVFDDHTFSIWATPTLAQGPRYPVPVSRFSCAGLASGGKLAAFVDVNGNVVFWHRETGETNWFARPTTNSSTRVVFSADAKHLAIGGMCEVCVLDVARHEKLIPLSLGEEESALSGTVVSFAFSNDGEKIIAGFYYGMVKVWDLSGAVKEVTLSGHDYAVYGLALLPDGRTIVSTSREVRFWDPDSGEKTSFQPRLTSFSSCCISPDGHRLAVGAGDGTITIWDLDSRQQVITLKGHEDRVERLSFLSDGNTLVSVGLDQLRVWRAPSFEEIALTEKPKPRRE